MIEITGFKDIDDIIYDFKYGSRININSKPHNKMINELNDVLYRYNYGAGTLKARHECEYFINNPKLHNYMLKISYNNIWNDYDYRDESADDIIYL